MRTAAKPIPPITVEVELKLWASIEKRPGGIWAWLPRRDTPWRAVIWINGRYYAVNRVMWALKRRYSNPGYQIPEGMDVCHRNDVTPELYDCNWDNLWLGTHKENMADKIRKQRGNHPIGNRNGRRTMPGRWPVGDRHHFRLNPELICRGEDNGGAKLTWDQVHEIRALHTKEGMTFKQIGEIYGVLKGTIYNIVSLRTWKPKNTGPSLRAGVDEMSH